MAPPRKKQRTDATKPVSKAQAKTHVSHPRPKAFPFLKLPAELRDEIYSYLVPTDEMSIDFKDWLSFLSRPGSYTTHGFTDLCENKMRK